MAKTDKESGTKLSVHRISHRGIAGAIFLILTVAIVLFIIGLATPGWSVTKSGTNKVTHKGLWETCECSRNTDGDKDWFKATQAMVIIGLIWQFVGFILICIYMTVHFISKDKTLMALAAFCFLSVLFLVIGFIVWGVNTNNQNFSFALVVFAAALTFLAGILAVVQKRKSTVH